MEEDQGGLLCYALRKWSLFGSFIFSNAKINLKSLCLVGNWNICFVYDDSLGGPLVLFYENENENELLLNLLFEFLQKCIMKWAEMPVKIDDDDW